MLACLLTNIGHKVSDRTNTHVWKDNWLGLEVPFAQQTSTTISPLDEEKNCA